MLTPEIVDLAAKNGLHLIPSSVRINDMGLDFQVALVRTESGDDWILRIPRRPEVMQRAAIEARVLELVSPRLDVSAPEWRIHTEHLIAYPLLPGVPGVELNDTGEPKWAVDASSSAYSASLGEFLAQLHQVPLIDARPTGINVSSPSDIREEWRKDVDKVAEEFTVSPALLQRWRAWIDEDSYWPDHCVLTHGEVYPGHTLVEGNRICGVIDWTTAQIGDPARDLQFHHATATPEAFALTLDRYQAGGGTIWPRLVDHCTEMFSASPVAYGLYALETGDQTHREAAQKQLNPEN